MQLIAKCLLLFINVTTVFYEGTQLEKNIRSCTSICLKIKEKVLEKYEIDKLKEKKSRLS